MTEKQNDKIEKTDNATPENAFEKKRQDGKRLEAINTAEKEHGGYKDNNLPEPTRFTDWESKGRCSDF